MGEQKRIVSLNMRVLPAGPADFPKPTAFSEKFIRFSLAKLV
jgi:hypothetical protein